MAKRCIFYGKELDLFGKRFVLCGDTDQSVCSFCHAAFSPSRPRSENKRWDSPPSWEK